MEMEEGRSNFTPSSTDPMWEGAYTIHPWNLGVLLAADALILMKQEQGAPRRTHQMVKRKLWKQQQAQAVAG
jgi:hypothetical protein